MYSKPVWTRLFRSGLALSVPACSWFTYSTGSGALGSGWETENTGDVLGLFNEAGAEIIGRGGRQGSVGVAAFRP